MFPNEEQEAHILQR